jgi:hypothetical protein
MTTKKEADLEAIFRALCRKAGCLVEKLAPTRRGMPDRIVLAPGGRIFLVELKRENEKPTPIQEEWHKRAWIRGVKVVVLTGEDEIRQWASSVASPEPYEDAADLGRGVAGF